MSKQVKIGIDLGATRVKMAVVDRQGRISYRREASTPSSAKKTILIDAMVDNTLALISESRLRKSSIKGVGIGAPGPIDYDNGVVRYFPNIKGWKNTPLKDILQKKLNLRVSLDNDVNAMTLGEYMFGAGKDARNLVCLTLGTGVGGGLIINGSLYRGSIMCAGEIGHMQINENGPICNCGGTACLERYIGNRYILDRCKKIFGKNITLEDVTSMAKKGNKKAIGVWEDMAKKLAVAVTSLVNVLNPDKVVIGGGVSKAGKFIMDPLKKEVKRRAMRDQGAHVKIVRARLGTDAGIIGASLLV